MLLIDVEMTDTETCSKVATSNFLAIISPVEHRILSFSCLIAARCYEEILINPCDLAILWPGVRQSLDNTVLNAGVKVQELTTLADNT
jgi:hypothetical protein